MADGDIAISDSTGKPQLISGAAKASQDLAEILLTPLVPDVQNRSSVAFPKDYGSELASLATPVQFGGLVGRPLVTAKISECVTRLQNLQKLNPQTTSDELIESISRLLVDAVNPTDFIFFLEVNLATGTTVELSKLTPVKLDHLSVRSLIRDDRLAPRLN